MPPRRIPVYIQRPQKPRTINTALTMVKQFLTTLNDVPDIFLPLKDSAPNLPQVQIQPDFQAAYIEFVGKLAALHSVAAAYSEPTEDTNLQERLLAIAVALNQLAYAMRAKQYSWPLMWVAQPPGNVEAADIMFRRMSSLLAVFQFATQIKVKVLLGKILQRLGTSEEQQITRDDAGLIIPVDENELRSPFSEAEPATPLHSKLSDAASGKNLQASSPRPSSSVHSTLTVPIIAQPRPKSSANRPLDSMAPPPPPTAVRPAIPSSGTSTSKPANQLVSGSTGGNDDTSRDSSGRSPALGPKLPPQPPPTKLPPVAPTPATPMTPPPTPGLPGPPLPPVMLNTHRGDGQPSLDQSARATSTASMRPSSAANTPARAVAPSQPTSSPKAPEFPATALASPSARLSPAAKSSVAAACPDIDDTAPELPQNLPIATANARTSVSDVRPGPASQSGSSSSVTTTTPELSSTARNSPSLPQSHGSGSILLDQSTSNTQPAPSSSHLGLPGPAAPPPQPTAHTSFADVVLLLLERSIKPQQAGDSDHTTESPAVITPERSVRTSRSIERPTIPLQDSPMMQSASGTSREPSPGPSSISPSSPSSPDHQVSTTVQSEDSATRSSEHVDVDLERLPGSRPEYHPQSTAGTPIASSRSSMLGVERVELPSQPVTSSSADESAPTSVGTPPPAVLSEPHGQAATASSPPPHIGTSVDSSGLPGVSALRVSPSPSPTMPSSRVVPDSPSAPLTPTSGRAREIEGAVSEIPLDHIASTTPPPLVTPSGSSKATLTEESLARVPILPTKPSVSQMPGDSTPLASSPNSPSHEVASSPPSAPIPQITSSIASPMALPTVMQREVLTDQPTGSKKDVNNDSAKVPRSPTERPTPTSLTKKPSTASPMTTPKRLPALSDDQVFLSGNENKADNCSIPPRITGPQPDVVGGQLSPDQLPTTHPSIPKATSSSIPPQPVVHPDDESDPPRPIGSAPSIYSQPSGSTNLPVGVESPSPAMLSTSPTREATLLAGSAKTTLPTTQPISDTSQGRSQDHSPPRRSSTPNPSTTSLSKESPAQPIGPADDKEMQPGTQPPLSLAPSTLPAHQRPPFEEALPIGSDPTAVLDHVKRLIGADVPTPGLDAASTPQARARPVEGIIQDIISNNANLNVAGDNAVITNYNPVNIHMGQSESDKDTIEKYLVRPYHVPGAVHDAQLTGVCMEDTRVQFLAHAKAVISTREGANIVWITGMAGTGKTTVASTLCQQLSSNPTVLVGGTFFCSRSAVERTEVRRIIPTLATLLFRAIPACTEALAAELKEEPELGSKSILVQVERLLAKPLESLGSFARQIVFVIDALDQCSDHEQLVELIDAFADLKSPVPVKFLLTSRPVSSVRKSPAWNRSLRSFLELSIDDSQTTADIHLFIQKKFEKTKTKSAWFTLDDLSSLATLANGLFVFAAVAVKYILHRDPPQRLKKVQTQTVASVLTDSLVKIYTLVLNEVMDPAGLEPDELEQTRKIIAAIVSSRTLLPVKTLADLLRLSSEQLRAALDELHSVVYVPETDEEGQLRVLHPTFVDFLFGPAPDHLRILPSYGHDALAQGCLHRLDENDLNFNVSRCKTSFEANPAPKTGLIAHSLGYACLHWGHHVAAASRSFDGQIDPVLRRKLLFWLEVIGVIGEVDLGCELLRVAVKAVQPGPLRDFLRDAISFTASSREAIEFSTAHIYISAVPFAPKDSLIHQTFSPLLKGIVYVEALGIASSTTGKVIAAVSSADRRVIASAASDGSIRAWDTVNRREIGTWTPMNKGGVQSVAVSADGRSIATGSADGVVRLWDPSKAQYVGPPLGGHGGRVGAIAFSPDGKCLVSGCDDNIVRVWEVKTRRQLHSMPISSSVSSVAYSPDGRMIGAGDASGDLHLYDVKSYKETKNLECGVDVKSLIFAPDSGFVLAASDNDILGTSFGMITSNLIIPGHTARVNAVAYSPDGKFIVSGADDATVRLWDAKSGKPRGPVLHGHSGPVLSVVFSPNGHSVVSAGGDGAIRTWDLEETKSKILRTRRFVSPTTPHYANGWILTPSPSNKPLILVPATYREQFGGAGDEDDGDVAAHHFMLTIIASDTLYYGERWIECWRGGS